MNAKEKLLNKIAFDLADTRIPFVQGSINGKLYLVVKLEGQKDFNLELNPVSDKQVRLTFRNYNYLPTENSDLTSDEYMTVLNKSKNKQLIQFLQIINPYLAD